MESTDLTKWDPSPLETFQNNGSGTAIDTRTADRRFYHLTAIQLIPKPLHRGS
jgi:hypothetical protein